MNARFLFALLCAAAWLGGSTAAPARVDVAAGRKHWAFQPLADPAPPTLADDDWSLNEVDRFILARLRAAGLQPSAQADPRTLIRRVSYDLTGLPPALEEVESFVAESIRNPQSAIRNAADRLLASPHYGEHWARHWLDVARYSDTKGYVYAREEKRYVGAWPYRDWVVRALNDDLPYDRFLLLQLAADQVEPAGSPHLAAMGFLTLGRRFLGVTHDIIDDRIDVTMRSTQALSVACARCHDHKFDPIPTRDYYALYGIFQSCTERLVPCGTGSADPAFEKELRTREAKLRETLALRRDEQSARVRATVAAHLRAQFELEKYPEETFSQILSAEDLNPVFVRRWQNFLALRSEPIFDVWRELAKLQPTDFAREAAKIVRELDGRTHPLVAQAFAAAPANRREAAERYGALFADVEKQWRELLVAAPSADALPDADAEALRRVLYDLDSPCAVPDEGIASIEMFFPTKTTVELWGLQGEVDRWLLQSEDAPPHATILVDRTQSSSPRIFKRGNPLRKGAEVPRQFLQVLAADPPPPFAKGSGRLELAQAIADPRNPLTARVLVNRVWMHHFGRGLVATPSDFGTRAEPPSHPELLDWLARRFIEDGWSLKALHRRILLSATYRQSSAPSAATAKARTIDPENRLLWRMKPHRLSIEEARDAWLAAAGELDRRVGGRPAELFAKGNTRRTLYALVDRERLAPALRTFDFANPDLSIPQRTETIVPQQALFGLNHPFLAARARALVQRAGSDESRVRDLYARLFQRVPTAAEMEAALAFIQFAPGAPITREQPNAWQYGYGEWDEAAGRMKTFTALPHFNGAAWQGGDDWPDTKLGWAQLTASGGHPGNDRRRAVARRWVAPHDGTFAIASTLMHEPDAGDGIRAFIGHSGRGLLRSTTLRHATAELNVEPLPMRAGDAVDFVVDIRDGLNSDQFLWAPTIAAVASSGAGGEAEAWDAQKDFAGPSVTPLTAWEQLAQTLLLTNEFMFVD